MTEETKSDNVSYPLRYPKKRLKVCCLGVGDSTRYEFEVRCPITGKSYLDTAQGSVSKTGYDSKSSTIEVSLIMRIQNLDLMLISLPTDDYGILHVVRPETLSDPAPTEAERLAALEQRSNTIANTLFEIGGLCKNLAATVDGLVARMEALSARQDAMLASETPKVVVQDGFQS